MRRFLAPALAAALSGCELQPDSVVVAGPPSRGAEASDPALVADGHGGVLLAWVAGDSSGYHLWVSRGAASGEWDEPRRVTTTEHDVHPHAEASPRFVAGAGVIGLVWVNQRNVPGRRFPASNVRFARSLDGGATWSPPRTLNDDSSGAPAGHTFHGAAWVGDSTFVVGWLDSRDGASAQSHEPHGVERGGHNTTPSAAGEGSSVVTIVASRDLGATWGANRALWESACPCCRVSLARDATGRGLAAWRQHFEGSIRDVVVASLPDGIDLPVAAQRVKRDDWSYPGCPHTGPALAAAGDREHVAWFTGKEGAAGVFYAARTGGGAFGEALPLISARTLQTAHPAAAALDDGGALVAWDVSSDGPRLNLARIAADGRLLWRTELAGSEGADHPVVALPDARNALVAWRQLVGGTNRVMVARVRL